MAFMFEKLEVCQKALALADAICVNNEELARG
jgi:hypothetical protein